MPSASVVRGILAALILAVVAVRVSSAETDAASGRPAMKDPSLLLLSDAGVRGELELDAQVAADLDATLRRHNDLLLALRDVGATGAAEGQTAEVQELRKELHELLPKAAQKRLTGLVLQAQGYDALTREDVAKQLDFTPEQRSELEAVMEEFWASSNQLQAEGNSSSEEEGKSKLEELQAKRHRQVNQVLDARQAKLWGQVLGAPFDFSKLQASPAWAPEFDDVEAWINGEPMTLAELRGQVVVVHFFAFGCSNCIANYPWYRQWTAELKTKPVALIGIHTPETSAEEDNDSLKASLAEHELTFPVAVDKSKKTWAAWHNGIWPSVYLIDKAGRLRYWWYGELDWQGAGGQKIMRQRIDQLLAEPDPEPSS